MSDLQPGAVLGDRFEIVGVLGHGGMATVYLARDRVRDESIALKVLHAHLSRSDTMRRRLRREVQASTRLRHPNALVALDLHELDGQLAVSMPLHPGVTLAEHVDRHGPLTGPALERIATQLVGALRAAHAAGLVHRDVTPGNVLVTDDGDACLTDFGLARFAEQHTRTATGALGTPGYAAPEAWSGARADPRSDLYGLGAVLYHAATGAAPFGTGDPMGVLQRQLAGGHVPLGTARPDLSPALAATVDALLRVDPERRPQGAQEVLAALQGRSREAPPPPVPPRPTARPPAAAFRGIAAGSHTVVVREMRRDRGRREGLRNRRSQGPLARDLARLAEDVRTWLVRDLMGRAVERTAEGRLAAAVAREAGLAADALEIPAAMLEREFRLVERVDESPAARLAAEARGAGFDARVVEGSDAASGASGWPQPLQIALAAGLLFVTLAVFFAPLVLAQLAPDRVHDLPSPYLLFFLFFFLPAFQRPGRRARTLSALPLAYTRDLRRHLVDDAPIAATDATPAPAPTRTATPAPRARDAAPPAPPTLAARTAAQVEALEALVDGVDGLPEPARRDLKATVRALRDQTDALARAATALQGELGHLDESAAAAALDRVESRLQRLRTLHRAGADHTAEMTELERTLATHQRTLELADALEARLTTVFARLLEIGASAAEARAQLVATPRSGDLLLAGLRSETRHATEALREVDDRPLAREDRGASAPRTPPTRVAE